MKWLPFSLSALAMIGATGASAHPRLLSATPAASSVVAHANRIELHFSEKLIAALAGADLTVTRKGAKAGAAVASATTVGADGKTMIVTPRAALSAGSYILKWHVVSVDTHRVAGVHRFSMR